MNKLKEWVGNLPNKTVVFDLDGVMFNTTSGVNRRLQLEHPVDGGYTLEDWEHYKIDEAFPHRPNKEILREKALKIWADPDLYTDLKPFNGFIEMYKFLRDCGFELVCHSLCWNEEMASAKSKAVGKYFPDIKFNYNIGDKKNKVSCFIFIEDLERNLVNSDATIKCLHTMPWNKELGLLKSSQVLRLPTGYKENTVGLLKSKLKSLME